MACYCLRYVNIKKKVNKITENQFPYCYLSKICLLKSCSKSFPTFATKFCGKNSFYERFSVFTR